MRIKRFWSPSAVSTCAGASAAPHCQLPCGTGASSRAVQHCRCSLHASSSRARRTQFQRQIPADRAGASDRAQACPSGTYWTRYLTLAPYGGNLEGRARGKPRLVRQGAGTSWGWRRLHLLVALPQSPEARRPDRHPQMPQKPRATACLRAWRGLASSSKARVARASEANRSAGRSVCPLPAYRRASGRCGGAGEEPDEQRASA